MTDSQVLDIMSAAMVVAGKLAGPLLITALVIGVVISLLQTVTQIQEMTLSFVPKVAGLAVVLIVGGNWMVREIVTFTSQLWSSIPTFAGG
jgi:flagellar biosynthesis protein FliQ